MGQGRPQTFGVRRLCQPAISIHAQGLPFDPAIKAQPVGVKVGQMAQASQRWQRNILKTITVAQGKKPSGLGQADKVQAVDSPGPWLRITNIKLLL
jgi:hypothetical protein